MNPVGWPFFVVYCNSLVVFVVSCCSGTLVASSQCYLILTGTMVSVRLGGDRRATMPRQGAPALGIVATLVADVVTAAAVILAVGTC